MCIIFLYLSFFTFYFIIVNQYLLFLKMCMSQCLYNSFFYILTHCDFTFLIWKWLLTKGMIFVFLMRHKQASIFSYLSEWLMFRLSCKVDEILWQQYVRLFFFAHLLLVNSEKLVPLTAIKSIFSKNIKDNRLIADQQHKTFIQIKTPWMTALLHDLTYCHHNGMFYAA